MTDSSIKNNTAANTPTVFHHIKQLQDTLQPLRLNKRIALVPTMGNLHQGHLELVKLAKKHADVVVVSVFVNPTQFGENEDFDSYPRTLDADVKKLSDVSTDYVFAPEIIEMYPDYPEIPNTMVHLGSMTKHLCGHSRPTHFDGVGLIVSKLFNIVQPHMAVFGKKDYQQLALIKQLTRDLSYSIGIIPSPIIRAEDGLALSSRNQYLTKEERNIAPQLNEMIHDIAKRLQRGEHLVVGYKKLINDGIQKIQSVSFQIDYLEIRTKELKEAQPEDKELVILVAAWLGKARLLDNQEVTVDI